MTLRDRLSQEKILLAPGVYDPLTANLAEAAGFEALYLSGAAVAYTRLGRPDIGLSTMTEMAETMTLIRDRTDLPVIMDADTGFGNALNAQRTMRHYERAGANALQVEDQTFPKRCGHLKDKTLVPVAEMVGKIKAMADARENALIVARTDALGVDGLDAALDRAGLYVEAGADVLFIESPHSDEDMRAITDRFGSSIPLLANMVEGGATPIHSADELEAIGFSLVIFPGGIVRAVARAAQEFYTSLAAHGTTAPFADRMLDFSGLNELLDTDALLAKGREYEGD